MFVSHLPAIYHSAKNDFSPRRRAAHTLKAYKVRNVAQWLREIGRSPEANSGKPPRPPQQLRNPTNSDKKAYESPVPDGFLDRDLNPTQGSVQSPSGAPGSLGVRHPLSCSNESPRLGMAAVPFADPSTRHLRTEHERINRKALKHKPGIPQNRSDRGSSLSAVSEARRAAFAPFCSSSGSPLPERNRHRHLLPIATPPKGNVTSASADFQSSKASVSLLPPAYKVAEQIAALSSETLGTSEGLPPSRQVFLPPGSTLSPSSQQPLQPFDMNV